MLDRWFSAARGWSSLCFALAVACAGMCSAAAATADEVPKKIVIIAGTVHQGPGGHPAGTHEYALSSRLLKRCLETAPNIANVKVELHFDGWPRDPETLDDADTIVVLSDGADRNQADHPLLAPERMEVLRKQMARGCGLVAIHWSVFVPNKHGEEFLEWMGGYFDYESGPEPRKWFSKIQTAETECQPATPEHPISRGIQPFKLREEYYYNIRFRPNDPRLVPILTTPIPGEAKEQVVAWAVERTNGGRGFGFTGGHFFDNWDVPEFRRMVLGAVLWTAHVEVPAGGVQPARVEPVAQEEQPNGPIQCLIVTGHQHPAHVWRDTTAALQEALALDKRMQVTVVPDPEFLATGQLANFDVMVLNYCNWQRPGLSDAAKENFVKFLNDGGGLALVHFSNGAFHASLPETPPSDWPEYRNICRRVWDHAAGRSSHDPYDHFQVDVIKDHPITQGLNSFETIDELYCNQQGDAPIEVLATAHSTVTNKDEPMAFVYPYGKGRVFQTVLGHAAESIRVPGEATLIRRGVAWAAGRAVDPPAAINAEQKQATAPPKLAPEGHFGAALDPRGLVAHAPHHAAYDARPITVECWAKVNSRAGFNILVANESKESADHWEIYTYAGAGDFSLYLPGCEPAEIRSGVNIADGQWHHVAAAFDDTQAKLYVDGKLVQVTPIVRRGRGGPTSPLWFGGYPPHGLGCDGLVDEVRISNVLRAIDGAPKAPRAADASTVGLWRFDRLEQGHVEDLSANKGHAVTGTTFGGSSQLATRWVAQDDLKLVSIDSSADESFLSLYVDTQGRLFAGGREALFVYAPKADGGYEPARELYRFAPDTWITDIDARGDDLYVITNAALYVFPRGRVEREKLKPRRLIWGTPVDLHVTYHGLAWGPEGDLYFCSGDPLLNYGDFQNRPDHWGHWTVFSRPEGTKTPYTGVGGFFRCRPDGSEFRVVAGGTRGTDGLAFDKRWNLFSDDNDHESLADRYSPARLLHVTREANFFWPRGWAASMSPERSDLLEVVNTGMGREAPVDVAYYDDPFLGETYRHSLLVACWGQRKVAQFALERHGATFRAQEFPFLAGAENARPVGVTVGRDGRVFVAISYMAGNEGSPKYPSEIVMITRADDPAAAPFEPYDAPRVEPAKLWAELSSDSTSRRQQAHTELLRRGGALLTEAVSRLKSTGASDPAIHHLPWLAAAGGTAEARELLIGLCKHSEASVRTTALRALSAFPALGASNDTFIAALGDEDAQVRHAAVVSQFDRSEPLPDELLTGPAVSDDTYLRQASAFLLARRAAPEQIDALLNSSDPKQRLAGVLAIGFRFTVPPAASEPPAELPLRYESGNAFLTLNYADETVDLKSLGRVGSFTIAERWKTVLPTADEQQMFATLVSHLSDEDDRVATQAGYFLWLLNDERGNELVTESRRRITLRMLTAAKPTPIEQAWAIGPFMDGEDGLNKVHAPQNGPIDLSASVADGTQQREWRIVETGAGLSVAAAAEPASSYYFFRVQSFASQPALLSIGTTQPAKLWNNGRAIECTEGAAIVSLDAGGNDLLLRVAHANGAETAVLKLQAAEPVSATLPEKLGLATLAERLQSAGQSEGIAPEFLSIDWASAAASGDAERGRRLFSADALGCAKCHAILPNQKGGGGPSLADASRRFTVSQLVESVLLPSKQVAPVFGSTSIVTDEGRAFTGLVVEENDEELTLLLATAARQVVAKASIEARKLQPTSPMPAGLIKTPEELGDILAYLLSENPRAP